MVGIVGIVVIFVMVFGGYIAAGGKMAIILGSLPFELSMIGGAAVGAFFLSSDFGAVKHTLKDIKKVFKGPQWVAQDYQDMMCLLFNLIRVARNNPIDIEAHIDNPNESTLFATFPKIQADKEAVALICDTLRSASMNYDDPHQVEEVLDKRIEASYHHALHSSHALQSMADGLPALGIVAAVLGVIKTMASIDQPPEVLGKMIGGALVGTFLGVFLAYGIVGPFATKVKSVVDDDQNFYNLIREILIASLYNHAPNLCIEVGRQNTPSHVRPNFNDLEQALKDSRQAMAA
ncbi:MAG TPA: flagellar motor stator protein MotA [Paracoccaceae bacterium]|nr:flagellar motor stator protein MotA [Paracoccaceae bacterium]